jgi:hypothetical protein
VFRNYKGERYVYPEPEETDCSCPYDECGARAAGALARGGCCSPAVSSGRSPSSTMGGAPWHRLQLYRVLYR